MIFFFEVFRPSALGVRFTSRWNALELGQHRGLSVAPSFRASFLIPQDRQHAASALAHFPRRDAALGQTVGRSRIMEEVLRFTTDSW